MSDKMTKIKYKQKQEKKYCRLNLSSPINNVLRVSTAFALENATANFVKVALKAVCNLGLFKVLATSILLILLDTL